ncbi:hypothetical protein O181_007805 [Austropuccinia psidii MF-1]|uniref:Uncharacterized protein n=1 Tax=Austropuccinia psidii MF-1 TaxID=1389203 RepID=A0A9Q3BNR0_9BASI|nr:hypothetical protein [Austropuccinia psidii MF-1]
MQQMTQIMHNLQAASSSDSSRPPAFKTPSMKAPEFFDGTKPFKFRRFIHFCQLIFHMIWQISLNTERKFSMPPHFSLEELQNGLRPIFQISPIKIQIIFSVLGNYSNPNSSPYLETQMKSEKLKQSWMR